MTNKMYTDLTDTPWVRKVLAAMDTSEDPRYMDKDYAKKCVVQMASKGRIMQEDLKMQLCAVGMLGVYKDFMDAGYVAGEYNDPEEILTKVFCK